MEILDVFLIVLLIVFSVAGIYLILALKKIIFSLDRIQQDIHDITENTIPVLKTLHEVSGSITNITSTAEAHVTEVSATINSIKRKVSSTFDLLKTERPEKQVMSFIQNFRAVIKGLSVFIKEFNQK
ncbi:MAG: hypothetical protein KJ799_04715 [Bacteroidetes bacterium]|nr:hypothetical protein [Bacteroidota bacterium]MBU1678990.1 hypothetical protein [Bacteroidota bacterium]MBU2506009.1 hypothetical protein [Bacteroidota bacterium]